MGTRPKRDRLAMDDRERFLALASKFTPLVAVKAGNATFAVSTSGESVGKTLFTRGKRGEMGTLAQSVKVMTELFGNDVIEGSTFVDVGANIGTTTITALTAHPFARAVACEPEPNNYRLLLLNGVINELEGRIEPMPVAVSRHKGVAELSISKSNSGGHHVLSAAQADRRRGSSRLITVEKVTLDLLVTRGILNPEEVGLIWIDTQGHEGHVLGGASSLVERGVPIVLEFHPRKLAAARGRKELQRVVTERYTHFLDLRKTRRRGRIPLRKSDEIFEVTKAFSKGSPAFTDLLLLRQPPGADW